ncbi:uncharacterized protein CTRU02_206825 [Colletotrichum truncatum]|uniref:Uncharacterized protein n=1 Tax=Colletotrichum truncatum TaxID=5467 RepID=A0ACC3YYX1_COLTU
MFIFTSPPMAILTAAVITRTSSAFGNAAHRASGKQARFPDAGIHESRVCEW